MKKILFTLMLLLTMTSAWAGTGDGTKEHPYTGEWTISELAGTLKEGDHLAYDCVIKLESFDGAISVYDAKLKKTILTAWDHWLEWAVGSPIGDKPFDLYTSYCSWNPKDRNKQTFIVTDATFSNGTSLSLSGYYSGIYLTTNGEGYLEVRNGAEFAAAIKANNSAKVKLEADIDVSNLGTICDTFSGQIYGKYQFTKEDGTLKDTVYSLDGGGKGAPLFNNLEYATIEHVLLYNMKVEGTEDKIGALAKTANNTTFNLAMMREVSVSSKKDNVGGMIGHAYKCIFDHVTWSNSSVRSEGVVAGGLVGRSSNNRYEHCSNNIRCSVFAEGSTWDNYARSGGFAGYSINDVFIECLNSSFVGGNEDSVGGFAGRSDESDFTSCINAGAIMHANLKDFNKVVEDMLKALDELDASTLAQGYLGFASVFTSMGVGALTTFGVAAALTAFFEGSTMAAVGVIIGITAFGGFAVFSFAALVATGILINQLTQHDEIGGISGQANGGQFSLCTNRGNINCKDSQGGGIVGRAAGVTVDNCLNNQECVWGDDDCGSIIGEAKAGCKVTNCLSTRDYPVIGYASDMNTASGNNYSLKAGDNKWEMRITEAQLKSGIVTLWLNNGVENRLDGAKPWRQNVGCDTDNNPVLDPLYKEVTVADFTSFTHITDAAGLEAFAQRVNGGDHFACAVLDNDIVMPEGKTWTPIGSDEDHSFRGIFDGHGHTISGLEYSTDQGNKGAGLFGIVHAPAIICNVTVKDSYFRNGKEYGAGGIVGRISLSWWGNVVIENCVSYANVYVKKHGGGILGRVTAEDDASNNVYVDNCYSGGIITTEDSNSALLCGYMSSHGHVSNSWSDGQLRNNEEKEWPNCWPYCFESRDYDFDRSECLVGYSEYLDIKNCYIVNIDDNVDTFREYHIYPLQLGVEMISDEEIATGELTYKLNGRTNDVTKSLTWQQNLGTDTIPVVGNMGVYHTRDISKKDYGTICVPYPLESLKGVGINSRDYYVFKEKKDEADGTVSLCFEYVDVVPAGTPALFTAIVNGTYEFFSAGEEFNFKAQATAGDDWTFKGTYKQQVFEGDEAKSIYYIDGTANKSAIKNAKKATINPFRAYFEGPSIDELTGNGSNAARVRIVIDGEEGETSALELVYDYENHNDNRNYTLFGTEAGEGYRGIVIRGGKKVMLNR